jgi:hypothetical protein
MKLSLCLSLTNQRGGGAADPAADLEDMLAGTGGFALQMNDLTRLWQESTMTTPVSVASDPIGAIRSKFGTTVYDLVQATAGIRPLWNGVGAGGYLAASSQRIAVGSPAYSQNTPALAGAVAFRVTDISSFRTVFQISTNVGTAARALMSVTNTGAIRVLSRRLDADADTNTVSAAGVIAINTPYVVSWQVDFAGTGGVEIWVNGASVATGTLAGSPANTSNTVTNRLQLGAFNTGTPFFNGQIGSSVFTPFLPTAGQRATMEAWLASLPFV